MCTKLVSATASPDGTIGSGLKIFYGNGHEEVMVLLLLRKLKADTEFEMDVTQNQHFL